MLSWAVRGARSRPVQTALLSGLCALVVAAGAFAPIFLRAIDQSVFRTQLHHGGSQESSLVAESSRDPRGAQVSPDVIERVLPSRLRPLLAAPRFVWSGRVMTFGGKLGPARGTILAQQDVCAGLRLVAGRCPTAAFEVAVSETDSRVHQWQPGTVMEGREDRGSSLTPAFDQRFAVVGIYATDLDASVWPWVIVTGNSGVVETGKVTPVGADALITVGETFAHQSSETGATARGWAAAVLTGTFPINLDTAGLDDVLTLDVAIREAMATGATNSPLVRVRSGIPDAVQDVVLGQDQARVIVPLLVSQLALLAAAVVVLVAGAAAARRRPETGLSRLRGFSHSAARAVGNLESFLAVAVGLPIGLAAGILAGRVASLTMLPPGVPFEVPPSALLLGLVGGVGCAAAVWWAGRAAAQAPVIDLLRRVTSRDGRSGTHVIEVLIVGVAIAAVVALTTGSVTGSLAVIAPALVALAIGLMAAWLVPPVARAIGRRALSRGRMTWALAATGVARRPLVRRIVTVVVVATALAVFAVVAQTSGSSNRDLRARSEVGAAAVAQTDARDIAVVKTALARMPRTATGPVVTPVVWVRQGNSDAIRTMAIVPDEFAQVADIPIARSAFSFDALRSPVLQPPLVRGDTMTVTVSASQVALVRTSDPYPDGLGPDSPIVLTARLTSANGSSAMVTFGAIPMGKAGAQTLSTGIPCTAGCALTGLGTGQAIGDPREVSGTIEIASMASTVGGLADLTGQGVWRPAPAEPAGQSFVTTTPGGGLALTFVSDRVGVTVLTALATAALPALVAPRPGQSPSGTFDGAGLDGLSLKIASVGTIPYAPGGGDNVAVVNLDTLAERGTSVAISGRVDVYLSDAVRLDELARTLGAAGIHVTSATTPAAVQARYDHAAPTWSLSLAPVVAVVALLMALLVMGLVAAADWTGRRHDDAALALAGVPARVLTRATALGYAALVGAAALLGAASGVLGSWLALPLLPLFTRASTAYQVDRGLEAPLVAATVGAIGLLLATAVAAMTALHRRRSPHLDRSVLG